MNNLICFVFLDIVEMLIDKCVVGSKFFINWFYLIIVIVWFLKNLLNFKFLLEFFKW